MKNHEKCNKPYFGIADHAVAYRRKHKPTFLDKVDELINWTL